ncbi:MAG: glycosyltransferase [Pseudomonadota bacterium]
MTESPRVLHLVASLGHDGAGVRNAVQSLSKAQEAAGATVRVIGLLAEGKPLAKVDDWCGAEAIGLRVYGPKSFGFAPRMISEVISFKPDIIHVHGLWLYSNLLAMVLAVFASIPYVVSTHGMLSRAALDVSSRRKVIAGILYAKRFLKRAHFVHSTSRAETEDIEKYATSCRVMELSHGVDRLEPREVSDVPHKRRVLFVGRKSSIKRLDLLIDAWSRLECEFTDWDLLIVGPEGDESDSSLSVHAQNVGACRVRFEHERNGEGLWEIYRSSDLLCLVSESENFGLVVAEALMLKVPVLVTDNLPWWQVREKECGLSVCCTVQGIRDGLRELMLLDDHQRYLMGSNGRAWMINEFSWDRIAIDSLRSYGFVIEQTS